MIKAIFFDLDDTLLWDEKSVKESFIVTCKVANEKYNVNIEELENAVRDAAKELYATYDTYGFTKMIGINPFEGLWGNFQVESNEQFLKLSEIVPTYRKEAWTRGLKALGINDPEFGYELSQHFCKNRRKLPFVYRETFQILDQLKKEFRLLLLTNGSPDLQNEKLKMTPELVPYFEKIVISGDFGKGKPNPELFSYALELMNLRKEEAMMVGDNLYTDILGAQNIGMKSIWINRVNKQKDPNVMPTYEIKNLEEIFPILESIKGTN